MISILRKSSRPGPRTSRRPQPVRHRPSLERLEERALPASFGPAQLIPMSGAPGFVRTADVNGDGTLDLLTSLGNDVAALLGNGDSTFAAPLTASVGFHAAAAAVADLNGDGNLDVATADRISDSVAVLLGNGNGTFQAARTFGASAGGFGFFVGLEGPVAADFNGDATLDLALANLSFLHGGVNTLTVSVHLGNGDGSFQAAQDFGFGEVTSSAAPMAVGDFGSDGKPDLVLAASEFSLRSTTKVLPGNGDGTFAKPLDTTLGSYPSSVTAGDFNGDGKLDLATANGKNSFVPSDVDGSGGKVSVLLGNGNGTFQPAQHFVAGTGPGTAVVSDFNADSKLDLAVVNGSGSSVSVLQGNGDGSLLAPQSFAVGSNPSSLAAGDLNRDGLPDLVVSTDAGLQMLLRNAPTNKTVTATTIVSATHDSFTSGSNITFLIQVTPVPLQTGPSPTGIVTLRDGTQTLATLTLQPAVTPGAMQPSDPISLATFTASLGPGQHNIRAEYSGDANFDDSSSSAVPVIPTETTLASSPNPSRVGQSITLQATVSAVEGVLPLGVVHFVEGEQFTPLGQAHLLFADLRSSVATFQTSSLSGGSHLIHAIYVPDSQQQSQVVSSTSATVTQVVAGAGGLNPNQAFVAQAIQQLLGRPPGLEEADLLSGLLGQGQSRLQIVQLIETSLPYRIHRVQHLFQTLLQRPADEPGLNVAVTALTQGTTPEQLAAHVLASDEYFALHGGTPVGFLEGAFQDALARPVSAFEVDFWLPVLLTNGRLFVATALFHSAEGKAAQVQQLYQEFLGRSASATDVAALSAAPGSLSFVTIAVLVGSQEYFSRANAGIFEAYVTALYRNLLEREPDSPGLTFWIGLLNEGATPSQVAQAFEASPEYRALVIHDQYALHLHRTPDAEGLAFFLNVLAGGGTVPQMKALVVGSAEYFQVHGGTNEGFLDGVYFESLGRLPDVAAVGFLAALNSGTARADVASVIFSSDEYRAGQVQSYYQQYLGRTARTDEVAAWAALLRQGARDEFVIAGLASSDEFFFWRLLI